MKNTFLVTGSSGFIGYHLSNILLSKGYKVIGVDALTNYYDKNLKLARNALLKKNKNYIFYAENLENKNQIQKIFQKHNINIVIHLAAQAGVRYSITNPDEYINSNIIGTFNLLEIIKNLKLQHLLLASTSSVYGANQKMPFEENDKADHQISTYASTKKSMELISHTYSHIYKIPTTVFRFFTVYGPWGRPDMALFKFTKNIIQGKEIEIYNNGNMSRSFTYIDDLINNIYKLISIIPVDSQPSNINDSLSPVAPWRVVNIGGNQKIPLMKFVNILELELGIDAKKKFLDLQLGDVVETSSDNNLLEHLTGISPKTDIKKGIQLFIEWYKNYSNLTK